MFQIIVVWFLVVNNRDVDTNFKVKLRSIINFLKEPMFYYCKMVATTVTDFFHLAYRICNNIDFL